MKLSLAGPIIGLPAPSHWRAECEVVAQCQRDRSFMTGRRILLSRDRGASRRTANDPRIYETAIDTITDLRSPSTIAEELIGPPPDGSVIGMKFEPRPIIRVGMIGVGERGTSILDEFLGVDGVQITALCDIVKDKCLNAQRVIEKSGHETPALFFNGDHDFENLCKRDDVDFIYIATPSDWHVPMAVAAMRIGKHAGVEVPAAMTLKE